MQSGSLTRERILDEAVKLVLLKGIGATSMNDFLAAAGIKKGTLYYHFLGKDELVMAVLQRAKTRFVASLEEALDAPTPADSIRRFFDMALEVHRNQGFKGGCLFGNTCLEMSDVHQGYVDSVNDLFNTWTGRIEAVIRAGQQAGQFRTDLTAGSLAQVIVSSIEGGIMMSRLKKEEGPLKTCLESLWIFLRSEASPTKFSSPFLA